MKSEQKADSLAFPVDRTEANQKESGEPLNKENMIASESAKAKILENMQAAYKGEVSATEKYAAYGKRVVKDGYLELALLYKAVSIAESIHAKNHKAVIEDANASVPLIKPDYTVKSTEENLDNDIKGEASEATTMYPEFLKTATDANNDLAYLSLTYAMKTERKHKIFYEKALGDIKSNTLKTMPPEYYVCPVCGNTYETNAPAHCDFSMTPREKFIKINSL